MYPDLKGKVILITGGSSGIGKATAHAFAKQHATVCITYNQNSRGATALIDELTSARVTAKAYQAELTNDSAAQDLISSIINDFGHIDILINNAGRYIDGDEWDGNADIWDASLQQNLVSAMSVSKYAIKHMETKQQGTIVNIASRHGLSGQLDSLTYAASKSGIINITQAYAKLMAPWGRANAVSPGAVRAGYWATAPEKEIQENTDGTLLKTMIEPQDIANAVIFLSSEQSRMITGQNLLVDAGYLLK